MNVSAVIVTRGDVDLAPVLEPISAVINDIVIWDNAKAPKDMSVYGRYAGIDLARNPFIYVQDDDNVAPVSQILAAYKPGTFLINTPADEHPWVSWGAVFPSELPSVMFREYLSHFPMDDFFCKWSDVVFGELSMPDRVDFGHRDLPWASAPNRMYQQPSHYDEQEEMRRRCSKILSQVWAS